MKAIGVLCASRASSRLLLFFLRLSSSKKKESHMKRLVFTLVVGSLALATPSAQQHDHEAQAASAPKPAAPSAARSVAAAEHPPDVFCETMKTGQLCSTGTTTLLGLTPEKREAWIAAVRTYNRAVNAAIMALQVEAKSTLSPAQIAEVNRWFAIGINPQINQILTASARPAGVK